MAEPLIAITTLSRVYALGATQVTALRDVTVQIDAGEFVAIMGPSGSGKSTLMNLIGCLDQATVGSYELAGVRVAGMDEATLANVRAQRLGFVFQQYMLLPRQTALRNVELPLHYRGVSATERRARAVAALAMVGMADRLDHRPGQLSGGQQQRVAIARALVGDPAVLLADEPTGALDSATGAEIMELLQDLNCQQGVTVIVVTHEAEVAAYARRVLRLRDGRLVDDSFPAAQPDCARRQI